MTALPETYDDRNALLATIMAAVATGVIVARGWGGVGRSVTDIVNDVMDIVADHLDTEQS